MQVSGESGLNDTSKVKTEEDVEVEWCVKSLGMRALLTFKLKWGKQNRLDIEESNTDLVNMCIYRGRQEDGAVVDVCHLE